MIHRTFLGKASWIRDRPLLVAEDESSAKAVYNSEWDYGFFYVKTNGVDLDFHVLPCKLRARATLRGDEDTAWAAQAGTSATSSLAGST